MHDIPTILSANIKRTRKIKGLSQKEVSLSAGIPQGQYSIIENGKVIPTIPTLEKIAKVLEVSLADLFSDSSADEPVNLPLLDKIKLIDQLEPEERDALMMLIDIAISKKKLKDNLSQLLSN